MMMPAPLAGPQAPDPRVRPLTQSRPWLLPAVLLLATSANAAAPDPAAKPAAPTAPAPAPAGERFVPRRPNIIFILADDLGRGEVGCYGQDKIRTPAIDRIAAEGARLTRAYSGSPVCAPARCTLMTGKHGGHAAVRDNREARPEGQFPVPAGDVMFPEILARNGYVCGAAGKWGLGPPGSSGDPLKRGFTTFVGYNCQRHAHNHYPAWLYENDRKVDQPGNSGGDTGDTYSQDVFERAGLDFIRTHKDRPFFLYLPFTVPHMAMQVPADSLKEYAGKWPETPYAGKAYRKHDQPRAAYAAMVTRMDRGIGRILDLLKDLDLERDTLVVFTSDNGPGDDYGGIDTAFFKSAGDFRGRKGTVYEGGLLVPMVVRMPGRIPAGKVIDMPAYFPDMLPTLLEFAGLAGQAPDAVDGISIAPTLVGKPEAQRPRGHLFWEFAGYGGQQAVIRGDWKAVRRNILRGNTTVELYNLKDDPGEKTDLASREPDRVKEFEALLKSGRTMNKDFPLPALGDPAPPADPKTPAKKAKAKVADLQSR